MDAIEHHHHHEQNAEPDQVMNEVRNRNRNRKDFGRDDCFRDQWRIIRDHVAIPHNGVAEQKPWQESAEEEYRIAVGSEIRSELNFHDDRKYERVADERHQRMDDGPEKSAERSDVAVLQIPDDKIFQKIAVRDQLSQ